MKSIWGLTRIALGWIFVWAFFDKLLGLEFATVSEKAWLAGGSPTAGFLKGATGSFAPVFNGLAGQMWVDWLFMAGLLGLGIALTLGIGMRIAAYTGSLLLLLMYLAVFPIKSNPFVDQHIIYILVLLGLYASKADEILGFGKTWKKAKIVKQYPILG